MMPLLYAAAVSASAGDVNDVVIDAVRAEMDRAQERLRLPDAEGPYHITAVVLDGHHVSIKATLGGLVERETGPWRVLGATVRVGSPELDSTNFEAWQDGSGSASLVHDDVPLAVRHDAWLLFDNLYKQAVEVYGAKEAAMQRRAEPDTVPDYAPGQPHQASEAPQAPVDADLLVARALAVSAVFRDHPDVEFSMVFVDGQVGRRVVLDTAGTEVIEGHGEVALRVVGRARASDGATQVDQLLYLVRSEADLPNESTLLADAKALALRLEQWRRLPVHTGEYVGPILFEDQAALDTVRYLLAGAFLGTPPAEQPPTGSRVVMFGDEKAPAALQPRRRVLPPGWQVDDYPERDPKRASAYGFDDEGEPARKVMLVANGVVKNHLMSRIPSEAFTQSTGHGRGIGEEPTAQPADLQVTAPRALSDRKLHRTAIKLAGDYGSDHYIVIRRLRDRAVEWLDGGALLSNRDFELAKSLPQPLVAVRIYRDGREEPFRGAALAGIDLRSFKEIVGAGQPQTATAYWGERPTFFSGVNIGDPVTITTPSLLFAEGVVLAAPSVAERPPRLPSPLLPAPATAQAEAGKEQAPPTP